MSFFSHGDCRYKKNDKHCYLSFYRIIIHFIAGRLLSSRAYFLFKWIAKFNTIFYPKKAPFLTTLPLCILKSLCSQFALSFFSKCFESIENKKFGRIGFCNKSSNPKLKSSSLLIVSRLAVLAMIIALSLFIFFI